MCDKNNDIWVFGDYRNYFKNRVTLQLLAKAKALSASVKGRVTAIVFGDAVTSYIEEYIAHGAEQVLVVRHPRLKDYSIETYAALMARLAKERSPEILLVGATDFGRELAPRVAQILQTGLTADCIDLSIDDQGHLLQTAPSFGGNLIARIITPVHRPQMVTVRPGVFTELPHNNSHNAEVMELPFPEDLPRDRVRLRNAYTLPLKEQRLENAPVVICGGRGMGSRAKFKKLYELARILGAEVGGTRPVTHLGWAEHDTLVGQAGCTIKPQVLFSFAISGAIQHTAAFTNAQFIIAVNKNPEATMMRLADVAIVADANQFCLALMKALKERIRD